MFVTLESGTLTGDVVGYDAGASTTDYTDAIIGNLGNKTDTWTIREVRAAAAARCSRPTPTT